MSAVAIGLLFLACGWKLYKDAIYTRYLALKNTGHPQYFGGALCAVLVFSVSYSIDCILLAQPVYRDLVVLVFGRIPLFADERQEPFVREFARIFIWAIPSTFFLVRMLNYPFHKSPSLVLAAARKTRIVDELEEMIYHALSKRPMLSILVTTKSKKVYIGIPKRHSPDPDRDRVWLAMWTLASGYRNEKGEIDITTLYGEVMSGGHRSHDDYQIVIPLAEIASAQAFDLRQYAIYLTNKLHGPPPASSPSAASRPENQDTDAAKRNLAAKIQSVTSSHQAVVAKITRSILSFRDRYSLRMNSYYVTLLVSAILLLPYVELKWALCLLLVGLIACYESIRPIQVRVEDWHEGRRHRLAGAANERSMVPAKVEIANAGNIDRNSAPQKKT